MPEYHDFLHRLRSPSIIIIFKATLQVRSGHDRGPGALQTPGETPPLWLLYSDCTPSGLKSDSQRSHRDGMTFCDQLHRRIGQRPTVGCLDYGSIDERGR